jgi:hypothetical protein
MFEQPNEHLSLKIKPLSKTLLHFVAPTIDTRTHTLIGIINVVASTHEFEYFCIRSAGFKWTFSSLHPCVIRYETHNYEV